MAAVPHPPTTSVAEVIGRLRRKDSGITSFVIPCYARNNSIESLTNAEMDGLADALSQNTEVREMTIHGSGVRHHRHRRLAQHGRRRPSSSPTIFTASFLNRILSTHPSLKILDLSESNLMNEHAMYIAEALKTNTSLKELRLNYNTIGYSGFLAILEALRENKTLESLYITNNKIRADERVQEELALSIEKSSLRLLDVSRNNLGDIGAMAIAKGIQENGVLVDLCLNNNGINANGFVSIAKALRCNNTIQILYMSGNLLRGGATRSTTTVAAVHDGVLASFETTLRHMNCTVERVYLGITGCQVIQDLCVKNRCMKHTFQQHIVGSDYLAGIHNHALWPYVLALVESKPDYLHALLKAKPEVVALVP